jgi:hypothetical protein
MVHPWARVGIPQASGGLATRAERVYDKRMSLPIGFAGLSLVLLALGGCAHHSAAARQVSPANDPSTEPDVPSKRRGVIVPNDPGAPAPSGTGTEAGHVDNAIGKSAIGGAAP